MTEESNTTVEAEEVKKNRGRAPSNVLSYRKFINAVKTGVILPGMTEIPQVVEGNQIKVHSGWKGVTLDIGEDSVTIRELATSGRAMRVNTVATHEFSVEDVFKALMPQPKKVKAVKADTPAE